MPWTLYKYILRELLKLLGLTTMVLVVVMSFAAAFKPMSDGLLTPGLFVKFVLFTAPTVLGLALPFAGAFASTLTFLRLSNDNEIVACSASGISYRRLLAPVFGLGLVLTVCLLLLANQVVPHFFRLAAQAATRDVVGLMAGQLANQEPFVIGDVNPQSSQSFVIYADETIQHTPPVNLDAPLTMIQLVELRRVAVGEVSADNRIEHNTTAERALLMVFEDEVTRDAWIKLELDEVTRSEEGYAKSLDTNLIRVPSQFVEDPKFFSSGDLTRLSAAPEGYDSVRRKMDDLAAALATESVRHALGVTRERAVLEGVLSERYVVSAAEVGPSVADADDSSGGLTLGGGVRVAYYRNGETAGEPDRTYTAQQANVQVRTSRFDPEPAIYLTLTDATVISPDTLGTPPVNDPSLSLPDLKWPARILSDDLANQTAAQLFARAAEPTFARAAAVSSGIDGLRRAVAGLRLDIVAERNQRAASAVSCALLILLGAVLSIHLRGQSPLTVYFWSFLLAIVTLIIISTGENVTGGTDSSLGVGLAVMWSGNALLIAVIAVLYVKVVRH